MTHFASRDLSFVSLSEVMFGDTTNNTQQCTKASGATACTCCTNDTNKKSFEADDADLPALHEQLLAAR
ncbi:MAG TPA: hypothetical protein VFN22_06950 [Gemmatimonadales bacterium]|nr:hypothetical protein [Gemmatimonadales bacterium]